MKAAVYIDGFNLYYGIARPLNSKWVDLQRLFEHTFPTDEVASIYFYQGEVSGGSAVRQRTYLSLLSDLPNVTTITAPIHSKPKSCRISECCHEGERQWFEPNEKHTDVAIAVQMVADALEGAVEKQILVTSDTDLIPAVRTIRLLRPKQKLTLIVPALDKTRLWGTKPYAQFVSKIARLDADLFLKCQLPETVAGVGGSVHVRPAGWRRAPIDEARTSKSLNYDRWEQQLPKWCKCEYYRRTNPQA